jgi:hypothetical protein
MPSMAHLIDPSRSLPTKLRLFLKHLWSTTARASCSRLLLRGNSYCRRSQEFHLHARGPIDSGRGRRRTDRPQ